MELSNKLVDAAVSYWKIPGSQYILMGIFSDVTRYTEYWVKAIDGTDNLFLNIAAAKNFTQLAVLRVISGAAEACRSDTISICCFPSIY